MKAHGSSYDEAMLRVAGALSVAGLLCVLLGERAVAQSVDAPSPLESG